MADEKTPKPPGTGVPPSGLPRPGAPKPATTSPGVPTARLGTPVATSGLGAARTPAAGSKPAASPGAGAARVPTSPSRPQAAATPPTGTVAPRVEPGRPVPTAAPKAPVPPPVEAPRDEAVRSIPQESLARLNEIASRPVPDIEDMDPELKNAVGFTHFDNPSSRDNLVTVLTTRQDLKHLASQTLVRIKSNAKDEDKRSYLGLVVRGPFAEPDAVSANSTIAVGVVVQGKKLSFTFDYHGRAEIEILGEESNGKLIPPGRRPPPKSPVYLLGPDESEEVLGMKGDMVLGSVVGYDYMDARIEPRDKSILPRHTGIIGTTGGGKSTTVATLIHRAQKADIATIVFDVEGEYTHVDEPTDHPAMVEALRRRGGQKPQGVRDLHLHHLMSRETRNPDHKNLHRFALRFSSLSPYAIAEILEMSDAQHERFLKAYDVTKLLLEDFKIFPVTENDRKQLVELDELSTGYPRMTIHHLLDVVSTYIYSLSDEGKAEGKSEGKGRSKATESDTGEPIPVSRGLHLTSEFKNNPGRVRGMVAAHSSKNEISWKALAGKLQRLKRLKIFDEGAAPGVDYLSMLKPGRVSVIDLSDTDSPQLNNLVIADILRGLQETQEMKYKQANEEGHPIDPALIIIEEAHEFLSSSRIAQMPVLFEQVARIAKRGRKRWLGLVFVTQLPQHLPNEVLGLLNNFIIHKMTDSTVISRMQRSVGGIDESLWDRVTRLAPGQAIASFSSFTRPLMIAVDPAPVKRLLVD